MYNKTLMFIYYLFVIRKKLFTVVIKIFLLLATIFINKIKL